jgi:hypothetical protein
MTPEFYVEPSPSQRQRKRDIEQAEIQSFYSGTYQQVHRYFQKQFPTADWRHEAVALVAWTTLAKVPPYTRHDQGTWNLDECWSLSATAGEFLTYLDDVKAGKSPTPDWAKNLRPLPLSGCTVPHSGSFGPAK